MNHLASAFVRFGQSLYPLLTSFALAAGCGSVGDADPEGELPDAMLPADPAPDAAPVPDAPTPLAAGALDPAFGTDGIRPLAVGTAYASALVAQGDKLLACLTDVTDPAAWKVSVVRLDAAGAVDPSFATEGVLEIGVGGGVACRNLVLREDGTFLIAAAALGQAGDLIMHYSADGTTPLFWMSIGATMSRVSAGTGAALFVLGSSSTFATQVLGFGSDGAVASSVLGQGTGGAVTRAFLHGEQALAVGALGPDGSRAWQVLRSGPDGLAPLGPDVVARSSAAAADLLSEVIELPDGSLFAVGGVGTGSGVMTARFAGLGVPSATPPSVTVESHVHGGPSLALGVTLDGSDRPIVVGTATAAGASVFGWQRYQAASTTLDVGYAEAGLASAAPPSGQGELVAAARLDGAIYALGHYDVETSAPHVALVKIAE